MDESIPVPPSSERNRTPSIAVGVDKPEIIS